MDPKTKQQLQALDGIITKLQSIHKATLSVSNDASKQRALLSQVRPILLNAQQTHFPQEFPVRENIFGMKIDAALLNSDTLNSMMQYLGKDLVLRSEGIFRLSGSKKKQNLWKERIQSGNCSNVLNEENDVHAIAGLFKEWLREMPEGLLGGEDYDEWISVGKRIVDPSQRMQCINSLILRIQPLERRKLLLRVLKLMRRVCSHSDENQMGSKNLSIVFGVNAIRPNGKESRMQDAAAAGIIWKCLIDDLDTYEAVLSSSTISTEAFSLPKPKLPSWSRESSSSLEEVAAAAVSSSPPVPTSPKESSSSSAAKPSLPPRKQAPPIPMKRNSSGKLAPSLPKKNRTQSVLVQPKK